MPTALIVEDEPEANRLLAMLVQLRGYSTISALSGAEAFAQVDRARPDLVFLDLMLPDINGLDVCRTWKRDGKTTGIPVIMVTARLALDNRIEGFRAGATEYVPKPYTPDQIFSAIAQADVWRKQVESDQESISIPLVGSGDDGSLRDLSRLRSTLIARGLNLDRFLQGLVDQVKTCGRGDGDGPLGVLDYHRGSDKVTLTIRDLDPRLMGDELSDLDPKGRPSGVSPAFAALIESGSFDESKFDRVEGQGQVVLTRRIDHRPTATTDVI